MAKASYQDILQQIKKKEFQPLYLLEGEEAYFIDHLVELFESSVLADGEKDFNQTILYGKDTDANTVIAEAKRYPMMAERVLVILKEAQQMRSLNDLQSYAEQPQSSTVLVIAHKYKKLDRRKKLYKTLSNQATVFESKKLYDNKIPQWIESHLRGMGYRATPKAVHLLAESLGTDLGRIVNELNKLKLIVPSSEVIDDETVEKNVGISKDFNNFELERAIMDRDFPKALRIQQYFAANPKDNPLVLTMSVLYQYVRRTMMVRVSKEKSESALAATLGLSPFFVKNYIRAAKNMDLKKGARMMEYLRDCDMRSKGVGNAHTSDAELLKELLFKIFYA